MQEPVLFIAPEKHPALCCRIGSLSSPFTATATFAGSSGFSAPFFPEDIGIDEGTGGNLVVGSTARFRDEADTDAGDLLGSHLVGGVHSIARSNGCVVECAHAVEFDGAAVCHVAT